MQNGNIFTILPSYEGNSKLELQLNLYEFDLNDQKMQFKSQFQNYSFQKEVDRFGFTLVSVESFVSSKIQSTNYDCNLD